jgi:hypothetical protein
MRVDGAGTAFCASEPLQIQPAPILEFLKPSFSSGDDYALNILGDQWGMKNSEDIEQELNIESSSMTDGILDARNSTNDPNLHLNVVSNVNADLYKYLTFRMKVDGIQAIGNGWINRIVWWYTSPAVDAVVTGDMIIYEGWQTYALDLSTALIEPSNPGSWSGSPIVFRIDPHEVPTPTDFHIDYVLLTSDHSVSQGDPYSIYYDLNISTGVTATFYYDTDQNPSNGRTLMQAYSAPAPPNPQLLFMPIIDRVYLSPEVSPPSGYVWVWDTTGVPTGTYYVSAEVADGLNTTTWYSEIPVTITS